MITDAQIRHLEELCVGDAARLPPPEPGVSLASWRLSIAADRALALHPDSTILSEDANRQLREAAKTRLASIWRKLP